MLRNQEGEILRLKCRLKMTVDVGGIDEELSY
jgi:hypothetical protein